MDQPSPVKWRFTKAPVLKWGPEATAEKSVRVTATVNGMVAPLTIEGRCATPSEERYIHCIKATAAGFPILVGGSGERTFSWPCVLVGTGPSAIKLLPEIRNRYFQGEEIIAIKGAHDWLIENGITPVAAVCLDSQRSRAKCFKRLTQSVLYMCASQMHPDAWDYLHGRQVLIWHSRIGAEQHTRPGWDKAYLVPHASTTGLSAILLLYLMGRRNFHCYGFDSSLPQASGLSWLLGRMLKLDGTRVPKLQKILKVTIDGKTFETTGEMAAQAIELEPMLKQLPEIRISAYGDGYFQALLAHGKASGWPV